MKKNKNTQANNKMNKNIQNKKQNQSVSSKSNACHDVKNSSQIGFEDDEETQSFKYDEDDSHSFELR